MRNNGIIIIIEQQFDDSSQFYQLMFFELDSDDMGSSKLCSILRYLLSHFIFQIE